MKTVGYTNPIVGATVTNATVTFDNQGLITSASSGSAPSTTITTQDEGVTLSATVNTLNFVGAGVVASGAGATTTVTISGAPAGSAGGSLAGTYPNPTINGVGATVVRSTNAAFATGVTWTWTAAEFDPSSIFDGTSTITIPSTGRYLVLYSGIFTTNTATVAGVYKNGVQVLSQVSIAFGSNSMISGSALLSLAAGDALTVVTVGTSITVSGDTTKNRFSVARIF